MEHLHTQIATAISEVLTGSEVTTLNGRVFPYRVYPAPDTELPYGCVWIPTEQVERESGDGGVTTLVEAEAEIMVALFFDGEEAELESLVNAGMLEVQMVLAAGVALESGQVDLDYRGCEKMYERGDMPYGQVLLKFVGEIAYQKDAPWELAWR